MSNTPMIEQVRWAAQDRVDAGEDDALEFYAVARDMGLSEAEADAIAMQLNDRVMRAASII